MAASGEIAGVAGAGKIARVAATGKTSARVASASASASASATATAAMPECHGSSRHGGRPERRRSRDCKNRPTH
jgi:hypothetical protein